MKTNRCGQQQERLTRHDSLLERLIVLFAERGRIGA